jgi:haloacetate dehalogenase
MWERADRRFAADSFHWGFLAQGRGLPERMIGADPDFWLDTVCRKWARDFRALDDAIAEYRRCFRRPEVIAATCADYRAGATLDDAHDRADLDAGRRIECPVLAIWSANFAHRMNGADPLDIWRRFAVDVRGFAVDCGHFIPEEAPGVMEGPLLDFLRR